KGDVNPDQSVSGSLSVAVPGMIRGLAYLHKRWAKKPWSTLVLPAQKLASLGYPVYSNLEFAINDSKMDLVKFSESKNTFLHTDGSALKIGEVLVQKNLSSTLQRLAKNPEDFYQGKIAQDIVASVNAHGGILTLQDLKEYQVKERVALEANWHGLQIVSMPPPSSGGIHVIQILKLLENDPLEQYGFLSAQSIHLEASAMQAAFADRARYLGDPDFVKVPVKSLISDAYLKNRRASFSEEKARAAASVLAGEVPPDDENNTSHLTIMDQAGNVVVSTQTINGYFGSALVAEGTGIVLNDEMDDFAAKPNVANLFGATATTNANQVEPRKTPLSSMSPTLVLKNGKPVLALGAPGGTRIITSVAQTILNYFVFHQDLYHSIAAPRIHQQWQPDVLTIENQEFSRGVLNELKNRGWLLKRAGAQSNVMAIAAENGTLTGVADPRDIGTSQGE
ncbi:MAG: gamma-glutamyltransferase, partial [Bdellovibrionales bacterium]|nr:gamma-glutamyltransferase [Oligoflexia bacterium]